MSGTTYEIKLFIKWSLTFIGLLLRTCNEDLSANEDERSKRLVAMVESRRSTTWPALSLWCGFKFSKSRTNLVVLSETRPSLE